MKFAIRTFGCRVNQADSFDIGARLRAQGAVPAQVDSADLVVVNTCTVTGAADQAARNFIRRIARRNRSVRIVVTGCYATRSPEDLASIPGVARLVTNNEKKNLFRLPQDREGDSPEGASLAASDPLESVSGAAPQPGVMGRTAYPLRVQTGCEERCAFCIVPSTRGQSRSAPVDQVMADVARLTAAGYRELWLVGVHLGSYGRDLVPPGSLLDLLRALDVAPGDVSFRIGSLEPMDCSRDLVELIAASGRLAPHFHLPLQHGSERVLRAMRRPYSPGSYRSLVDDIRARLPHASIGADVIAGFPGESEEDARELERFVAGLPLSYVHVFPYSDRPGTAAAAMTPKVAPDTVKARAARLRRIGERLSTRFMASQIGETRPGLTIGDGTTVLTDNFLKVRIPPGLARNVRVNVRIETGSPAPTGRIGVRHHFSHQSQ